MATKFETDLEDATEAMDRIRHDAAPLGKGANGKDCATVMNFLSVTVVNKIDEIKTLLD